MTGSRVVSGTTYYLRTYLVANTVLFVPEPHIPSLALASLILLLIARQAQRVPWQSLSNCHRPSGVDQLPFCSSRWTESPRLFRTLRRVLRIIPCRRLEPRGPKCRGVHETGSNPRRLVGIHRTLAALAQLAPLPVLAAAGLHPDS
jgi:hypothetical protein